jgi:hypothetical protein
MLHHLGRMSLPRIAGLTDLTTTGGALADGCERERKTAQDWKQRKIRSGRLFSNPRTTAADESRTLSLVLLVVLRELVRTLLSHQQHTNHKRALQAPDSSTCRCSLPSLPSVLTLPAMRTIQPEPTAREKTFMPPFPWALCPPHRRPLQVPVECCSRA